MGELATIDVSYFVHCDTFMYEHSIIAIQYYNGKNENKISLSSTFTLRLVHGGHQEEFFLATKVPI